MDALPKNIGPYKIHENLGEGRFATVYRAVRDSNEVALKVLKPEFARNSNQVERFKREAQTIAELTHENIIRILDTGKADEAHFLAMEYISGGSLDGYLEKKGALSRSEVVPIIDDISAALMYAHSHEKTIIHRDLKPANILLNDNQKSVQPILTDFGIVKFLSKDTNELALTETGEIFGTYYYMSPEQWDAQPVTPVSDLYALAVILFEMLAGQRPFQGSYTELMTQHLSGQRPRLSKFAPHVGTIFDDILIQAMSVNPQDRFQSVDEFSKAIEEANEHANRRKRLQDKRHKQVSTMIEAADIYLQQDTYDPDRALAMIDAALEVDPRYIDALLYKGRIHFEREQYAESLEVYQQAFELTPDPSSETGIEYLNILQKVAEIYWNTNREQAVEYYHRVAEILEDNGSNNERIRAIWRQVQPALVQFHQKEGERIYAHGSPQDLAKAIEALTHHIEWLDRLKAESTGLLYQRKQLQVKQNIELIQDEENNIKAINVETLIPSEKDKISEITQSYFNINKYYLELIKLRPEDRFDWEQKRCRKLKEYALLILQLAQRAATERDFETAIQYYRGIDDIKRIDYPNTCEELGIDIEQEIKALEEQADYENKYKAIIDLILDGDLQMALENLERDFIHKGDFEYRNVARLLWRLIHAKQQGWTVPADWVIDPFVEKLEIKPQPSPDNNSDLLQSNLTLTAIQVGIIIVSLMIGILLGLLVGYFILL